MESKLRAVVSVPVTAILHTALYLSVPAVFCATFARDVASELLLGTVGLIGHFFRVAATLTAPRAGAGDLEKSDGAGGASGINQG